MNYREFLAFDVSNHRRLSEGTQRVVLKGVIEPRCANISIPALRKTREERGTPDFGDAGEIKARATRPREIKARATCLQDKNRLELGHPSATVLMRDTPNLR